MNDPEFNLGWLTHIKKEIISFHKLMGNKGNWPRFPHSPYMDIEYVNLEFYPDLPKSFLVVRLDEIPRKIVLLYPIPSITPFSIGASLRYLRGEKDADGSWVMSAPSDVKDFKFDTIFRFDARSFLSLFPPKEDGRGKEFELDARRFPKE